MKSNLRITTAARFVSLFMAVIVLISGCGNASTGNTNPEGNSGSELTSDDGNVSIEKDDVAIVGDGTEEAESDTDLDTEVDTEVEPETEPEPELTAEEKLWQTRLLANAKNNLNVRAEASTDATIVGKLERGDYADIIEKGEEWTKIVSGNVEGYVYNEYCLFGNEAMEQAKEIAKTMATVSVDNLRVRKEANTSSKVITKLMKGDKIEVNEDIEAIEGWIAVIYEENTCYMSADYLTIDVELSTGMTMEEIKEQKRLEEERKKAEAAAKKKAKEQAAVDNASDVELLAALIYCEAGAESYDAQLAVGACVVNRMKHKNYPDTLRGVIFQKNQFTPAGSGKVARILLSGKATASCIKAAKAALAGEDNTNGCRSFRLASTGRKGIVYGKIVFFSNN
ncbi:MAG: SH3 domain-containing protein [Agathobacter sp.]|nr:SH3 domain-containing protein [Agathobacter sp.]